jgi:uncharacterized membrane protein (DUF4010 family)
MPGAGHTADLPAGRACGAIFAYAGSLDLRELRILLAMVIGLLIGVERERRRAEQAYSSFAGVRTFGLVGLLGGMLGYLGSTPLIAVGAASIALLALVAYVVNRQDEDRGVTTEVALMVTFSLGVLSEREPTVAAATGVIVTVLLALRTPLHRAVRERITSAELRDGLLLLVFALVVLPLAPQGGVGPYGAIHPASLIRLVVVMMVINAIGQAALRLLGARVGLPITGLAGGFVSSSATIASMSLRAKQDPNHYEGPVAGALASCVATGVQYLLIVATLDRTLLGPLALPLGATVIVAGLGSTIFALRAARDTSSANEAEQRPFRLVGALALVAVYCVVSVLSAALHARLGATGTVLVSATAGLVDAHSTAGALAAQHLAGQVDTPTVLLASLTALSTNSVSKIALAWTGRHRRFGMWTTLGVLLIALSAWSTLLLR